MHEMNATEARRNWSELIDQVVRTKPQFIRRTRDRIILSDEHFMGALLEPYTFSAESFEEGDGTVTLSLNEIDLIENGQTIEIAKMNLANSILEYAEEFYSNFEYWGTAPNRKKHIPYVFKALILQDSKKIGDAIQCQIGKI